MLWLNDTMKMKFKKAATGLSGFKARVVRDLSVHAPGSEQHSFPDRTLTTSAAKVS
jgi:hypothetical protein